jgi:hypothetical protein
MKKLDLNIVLDKSITRSNENAVEVAINWLLTAVNRAINKPDQKGNPTIMSNMDTQRKVARIMRVLDGHKDGIVNVEDGDFDFIYSKFHKAEFPVGRDVSLVLESIEQRLDKAKNG